MLLTGRGGMEPRILQGKTDTLLKKMDNGKTQAAPLAGDVFDK
jgi:hypothetical protein